MLNRRWRALCKPHKDTVTKQWVTRDGPPRLASDEFNLFQGYVHKVLSDKKYESWRRDPELALKFDLVHSHSSSHLEVLFSEVK